MIAHRAIAHREIIFEIDLLERGILPHQFDRKRRRLPLPRDRRMRIALGPSVIVPRNALQHPRARLRLAKQRIAPCCGECARQLRVIGMLDQPPSSLRLHPQHCSCVSYSASWGRLDSCQLCRKNHSRNITIKKKTNPNTVAAKTSANR